MFSEMFNPPVSEMPPPRWAVGTVLALVSAIIALLVLTLPPTAADAAQVEDAVRISALPHDAL